MSKPILSKAKEQVGKFKKEPLSSFIPEKSELGNLARKYASYEGLGDMVRKGDQQRKKGHEWFNDSKMTDQEVLEMFKKETHKIGDAFMTAIRDANFYDAGKSPKRVGQELQGMNKSYANMMVMACLFPLAKGISPTSVLTSVSMGTTMWLLSPNFRQQMGDHAFSIRNTILKAKDSRIENKLNKLVIKAERKEGNLNPFEKFSISIWNNRYERALKRQRGGMEPFTAKSAAMASVALMENAYNKMREDGVDPKLIETEHNLLQNKLYQMAKEDGISAKDLDANIRMVCSERMRDNPNLYTVFEQTAHGNFYPLGTKMDKNGEKLFISTNGNWADRGSLSLRLPQDEKEHWSKIKSSLLDQFGSAKDVNELKLMLGAYFLAHGGIDNKEMHEAMVNSPAKRFAQMGDSMVRSMVDDGMSLKDAKKTYVSALFSAIDEQMEKNGVNIDPEMKQEFTENLMKAAKDPYAVYQQFSKNSSMFPEKVETEQDFYTQPVNVGEPEEEFDESADFEEPSEPFDQDNDKEKSEPTLDTSALDDRLDDIIVEVEDEGPNYG